MKLRRFASLLALAAALAFGLTGPAQAADLYILQALGAQTGPGTGTVRDLGNYRNFFVVARVTTGSGTVTTFDVWLECSIDGTNFTECAVDDRVKATTTGAGPHTDNTIKVIVETTLISSSTIYSARLPPDVAVQFVRARWNIVGTTPSETFEVALFAK